LFTAFEGYLFLAAYGGFACLLGIVFSGRRKGTKNDFLLADRSLKPLEAAFSIAATWIWAPALFVAARLAYQKGFAGVFWFTVPNVLCLVLFAFFAERVRKRFPGGFTLSHYILSRTSRRVQALYWVELVGLALCSFAVQLLAGGKVIALLTGIPFSRVTLILVLIVLAYSAFSGLKASVVTDLAQMGIILAVLMLTVPWVLSAFDARQVLTAGWGGIKGTGGSIFSGSGPETAFYFGIPVTIGLLAGPFGDQSFWQRAFALPRNRVRKSFFLGAALFSLVPVATSLFGFIAAGLKLDVDNPELVNLEVVIRFLPAWAVAAFVVMLISGLTSTLDSNLCAVSCIAGHDFQAERSNASQAKLLRTCRGSMAALALAALGIANIPGIEILYLFLFYGTLRASTLLPTVICIVKKDVNERGMFWGILLSFFIGLPLFAYGNFLDVPVLSVAGSLATVSISGIVTWLAASRSGVNIPAPARSS
jgi:Na+/proline symporter